MTTTLSKSFASAVGVSSTFRIGKGETITYGLSGTYVQTLVLEQALTPDESSWKPVAGPFATEDGTFSGTVISDQADTRYRWRMSAYTSGTCVATLTDGVRSQTKITDQDGKVALTLTDDEFISDRGLRSGTTLASGPPVSCTSSTLTVTAALHAGRTILLDKAAGIAVTLPAATGTGDKYRFIVKTTFTGASSIKSVASADIMIGHALMGNDSDNSVVDWQSVVGSTNDTIDLLGTSNSTGGMAGQEILIEDIATNLWFVSMRGDAAGTEASPFANTVS